MDQYTVGIIRELISGLEKLSSDTEIIYGSFAVNYPKLMTEVGTSVKASQKLVNQMKKKNRKNEKQDIVQRVRHTKRFISEASYTFTELQEKDDELLQVLNENIKKIEQLKEHIRIIRQGSESMELISLNAMTVAIKAGTAGGAFSYITDDLKRLSAQTIGATERLTDQGDKVQVVFARFRSDVERVEQLQKELFSDFVQQLEEDFSVFYQRMKQTGKSLELINTKINMINEPLMKIMHEIQKQDIIRQSIDHVIMTLKELNMEINDHVDKEEMLDELTFCKALPNLAGDLLTDIQTQINESYKIFIESTNDIQVIISQTEDFYQMLTGKDKTKKKVSFFDTEENSISRVTELITNPQKIKKQINEESKELLTELQQLEDEFKKASNLIHRFHNINVASKIEIAKQPVLRVMDTTVTEMTNLTGGIEESIENATKTIRRFIKRTKAAITRYKEVFEEENIFISSFSQDFRDQFSYYFSISQEMNKMLGSFSLFSDSFLTLFEESKSHLEMMKKLTQEISSIQEELNQIRSNAEIKEKTILDSMNLESWNIKNHKIQQVVEQFTILAHKKRAGDIVGFQVEEGTDEGEVTFF